MRVRDIMDRRHPSIYADELATKVRAILRSRGLRVLPVVDERKHLIGIVSRSDLMTITSSISPIRVKGIMSSPSVVSTVDMEALHVAREMFRLDQWYSPVVKSSQDYAYLGVLGLEDLMRVFLKDESAKLSKPLSEIMSTELVTCSPDDEVDNVWRLMQNHSLAGLPIVKSGRLVGILTQKDLLDSGAAFPAFESKKGRFKTSSKIASLIKTSVITLKPSSTVREATEFMLEKNIGRIPIVDEKERLVGMVDREDIVKATL